MNLFQFVSFKLTTLLVIICKGCGLRNTCLSLIDTHIHVKILDSVSFSDEP